MPQSRRHSQPRVAAPGRARQRRKRRKSEDRGGTETSIHYSKRMTIAAETKYHTSGLIPLTRPQLIWTLAGLMLALLLSALDQTIVGTAEPRIISTLSGFDRYPWVATAYLLSSTIAVPIFAKLSDIYGRKWFFLGGAATFVLTSALC